jgi:hypothetical protein
MQRKRGKEEKSKTTAQPTSCTSVALQAIWNGIEHQNVDIKYNDRLWQNAYQTTTNDEEHQFASFD